MRSPATGDRAETVSVTSLKSDTVSPPPGGRPVLIMPQQRRKQTQRQRLVTGMIEATNRRGYAQANIAAVIAHAGVSRPTFYDYFEDRDACFLASIVEVDEELRQALEFALAEVSG
jgi:AcrR family transcriptional regulator